MEPDYTCPTCLKSFKSEGRLAEHTETAHQKRICAHCGKIYINKRDLSVHISRTHGDNTAAIYDCTFCSLAFKHPDYLALHIKRKHSENTVKHECSKCGKMFTTKFNKKQHEAYNCPTITRREELSDCDDDSSSPSDFPVHAAAAAPDHNPQIIAPPPLKRNPLLLVRKERPDTSSSTLKCSKCGKMFTTKQNRRQHEAFNCPAVIYREDLTDWEDDPSPLSNIPVHAAGAAAPDPSPEITAAPPLKRNPLLLVRKERPATSNPTPSTDFTPNC